MNIPKINRFGRVDSLASHLSNTFIASILMQALSVITSILISRILGVSGRGEYALFFATSNFLGLISTAGLSVSVIYFISAKNIAPQKINTFAAILLAFNFCVSLVFVFLTFFPVLKEILLPAMHWDVKLAILLILMTLAAQINAAYSALYQGYKKFRYANKVLLLNSVYNFISFTTLFILQKKYDWNISLSTVVFISLICLSINLIHLGIHLHKTMGLSQFASLTLRQFTALFKFNSFNYATELLGFLNQRVVLWIIAFYWSTTELGIFAVALGIISMVTMITAPIHMVLVSHFTSSSLSESKDLFSLFSRLQFVMLLLLTLLGGWLTPYFISFAFGEDFLAPQSVIWILFISLIFYSQSNVFSSYLISQKRLKINLWSSILSFALLLFFAFILTPKYGILGTALAQLIAFFGQFILQLTLLWRKDHLGLNLFILKMKDLKFIKSQLKGIGL